MLAAVFSFRGRINRLQYFLGNLAVGAAVVLLSALTIGFIDLPPTTQPTFALAVDAVMLVLAAPLVLWIGASLQVRRFRDIGCGPALAIPAWIGVLVAAGLVTQGAAQSQIAIGTAINFAVLTCLYVWPGKRGRFGTSRGGRTISLTPSSAFSPARRLAPARISRR